MTDHHVPDDTAMRQKFMGALFALNHISMGEDVSRAVFVVTGNAVGGPDGDLPIDTASFALSAQAAHLMLELADAMKNISGLRCTVSFPPSALGIGWAVADSSGATVEESAISWTEPDEIRASLRLKGAAPDVSTARFTFTEQGNIWFTITADGPSTADVFINPEILREIAEGPADALSPSL
jgi:hypothetical protein